VPEARKLAVAEHYYHFGGVSPINAANRRLIDALRVEFDQLGIALPIYWGNRNWKPYLIDTLTQMRDAGVLRAVAFITSALSSYSGCRQYLNDIAAAREAVGEGAPEIVAVRRFFNHPLFVSAAAARLLEAFAELEAPAANTHVVFTAHSIPMSMSELCDYAEQFREVSSLVAEAVSAPDWSLAYQSRSGPPSQPWLEPDILDELARLKAEGHERVVICPIGFVSDHMEVIWDLDAEAREKADELGLQMARARTAGTHPDFVRMVTELVREHTERLEPRALGKLGPRPAPCRPGCCPAPARPARTRT